MQGIWHSRAQALYHNCFIKSKCAGLGLAPFSVSCTSFFCNLIIDKTASLSTDSESHHSYRSATRSLTRKLSGKGIQDRAPGTPGLPWQFPAGGGPPAVLFGPAQTACCQHASGCGSKASISEGTTSYARNQSNARSMPQVSKYCKRFSKKIVPCNSLLRAYHFNIINN